MCILLVEDNEMNRDMLSRRLMRRGHHVLLAETGEKGVEIAVGAQPDLILMDIGLPGISGLEATRILRQHNSTANIPIIAITAHALETDREQADRAGCDAFETKPIDFQRLLTRIEGSMRQVEA